MAKNGAFAVPIRLPLVTRKPLKRKMSLQAKKHYEELFSNKDTLEIYTDKKTGEVYAKVTNAMTGETVVRKCERTDED